MNKTATNEIRPWEQHIWGHACGKRVVLSYLLPIHILAVVGLIFFPLPGMRFLSLAFLCTALGGLGTTICYHRMLAHRNLKVNKIIEYLPIF
jgi:fatty-acid desaturase